MRWSLAMAVARKDWAELRANRMLLVSLAVLPLIFVVMPAVMIRLVGPQAATQDAARILQQARDLPAGLTAPQAVILILLRQWVPMFLVLPVFAPIILASQAIVGEKERRTLEPLLASPIEGGELLAGKTLSALVPGLLLGWGAFALLCVLVNWAAWPWFGAPVLPDETWLAAAFLLGPALGVGGNGLAVLISSRVSDARLAQQLAGLLVLPLVGLVVYQATRGIGLGAGFFARLAAVVAVADVFVYVLAVKLFDRERILLSWK